MVVRALYVIVAGLLVSRGCSSSLKPLFQKAYSYVAASKIYWSHEIYICFLIALGSSFKIFDIQIQMIWMFTDVNWGSSYGWYILLTKSPSTSSKSTFFKFVLTEIWSPYSLKIWIICFLFHSVSENKEFQNNIRHWKYQGFQR